MMTMCSLKLVPQKMYSAGSVATCSVMKRHMALVLSLGSPGHNKDYRVTVRFTRVLMNI